MTETSSTNTTRDIRVLYVDSGPVADAARILVETSTLADYLTIRRDGTLYVVEPIEGAVPLDMAGSATWALWRLLKAIASSRYEVSLYDVVSRTDHRNTAAVAAAISALCGAR